MLNYIIDRLNENSTWRGIIGVLTALGVKIRPDLAESIVSSGLALIGLINIFRKEKNVTPPVPSQNP